MTQFDPPWNPDFYSDQSPFDDLKTLFADRLDLQPPECEDLQRLLPPDCRTASGQLIQLIDQPTNLSAIDYETSIQASGQVPCRPGWHDLFNALMWATWPVAKAALNQGHMDETEAAALMPRSRRRDTLTLVDECGVILACCDPALLAMHRHHRWQALFVDHRQAWGDSIRPFVIGHGLYQQCLGPYPGLTAKACYIEVDQPFFDQPLAARYRSLDRKLADLIRTALQTPTELLPLPVLGVPGWCRENENPTYYQNREYFRPLTG